MKIAVRVLVIVAIAWVAPVRLSGQAPPDLAKAARERDQAVAKADAATWDQMTTDEFTVVQENGHLLTKAARLAEIRTHRVMPYVQCEKELVTVYGTTAVRRCLGDGQWDIEVWVKSARGWQVAAVQVTTVAK